MEVLGHYVDNGNQQLINSYMPSDEALDHDTVKNLDADRIMKYSFVVAAAVSEQYKELLILGNNIGKIISWTLQAH